MILLENESRRNFLFSTLSNWLFRRPRVLFAGMLLKPLRLSVLLAEQACQVRARVQR